mgnify:FL=1
MKTAIILLITAGIVYKVFSVIYKEYKKNKNFCGTSCASCSCSETSHKKH